MSNNSVHIPDRNRQRTLIIVEGKHEKNIFLKLLIKCFPELKLESGDIWIYGTNIYMLYDDIVKFYGSNWTEQDVDLPFILSKKKNIDVVYKYNFKNVLLIFDYERHDPSFEEEKIEKMQDYFKNEEDVGQLYINYPMIESYRHFEKIPDDDFLNRTTPWNIKKGHVYKQKIKATHISKSVNLPEKIESILTSKYKIQDDDITEKDIEKMLNINCIQNLEYGKLDLLVNERIKQLLEINGHLETSKHQLPEVLKQNGHVQQNCTYYEFLRCQFQYIIKQNILKCYRIQTNKSVVTYDYSQFLELDLLKILIEQNKMSMTTDYIWVINTALFFIANYDRNLLDS